MNDEVIALDNPSDPRLLPYSGLSDPQLREVTDRHREGLFIAEGYLVIERALETGHHLVSALTDQDRSAELQAKLPDGVTLFTLPSQELTRLIGFDLHRGALACFERPPARSVDEVTRDARLVVVLEGVNNPANVGAIARIAAGLGADALLLDPTTHDPLYRRALRVAVGETLRLPWARIGQLPAGLDELRAFTTVALTPSADALPIDDISAPRPIALLLGAEGPGLRRATVDAADLRVRIPMHNGVDSLNVAAAAAVAVHSLAARLAVAD